MRKLQSTTAWAIFALASSTSANAQAPDHFVFDLPAETPVIATINYTFPFLTIAAALLGGLVGGGARLLGKPGDGKSTAQRLGFGVLYGVVVFAAYAIGINLLPFTPAVAVGALSVFAISALAAYFGP